MHSFLHSLDGPSLPQLRGKLLRDTLGKHRQAPVTHLLSPFSPPVPLQSEAKGELLVLPHKCDLPQGICLGKAGRAKHGT